eukprot:3949861-Amphidinium_carterae.1
MALVTTADQCDWQHPLKEVLGFQYWVSDACPGGRLLLGIHKRSSGNPPKPCNCIPLARQQGWWCGGSQQVCGG